MKAILIGIISSLFFAVTFILNRSMELSGGSWMWSSSLRYFFMLPFLIGIVLLRGNLKQLLYELKMNPLKWILWSTVGFGLFYAPLTFAAASGPGWLVAGTWQFVIIAGLLVVPFFYKTVETEYGVQKVREQIPVKGFLFSSFIFIGIVLIQLQEANGGIGMKMFLIGILPVVVAAFAYPLGNRKMMEHCKNDFDTFQRVLGMTLASTPFWFIIAGFGAATAGLPSKDQVFQSFIVGISSGVIATVLFFFATELVKHDQSMLAAVEATQSTQIIFVIFGEVLLLSAPLPSMYSFVGLLMIASGMVLHSLFSNRKTSIKVNELETKSL
ncbi:multidrug resistance efflux transporter family protein [Bacillus timonensis]|uniref:Multidrug resistance efflux transporter family protein n=1 Tax=Bacillus timonensis TaxID=1033734 RepID=A0A4S3PU93_9BACI|nr:multidrug resistance efflux transporter family protein [Bacillus timonensis]THE13329.1 multidrug resistance efflux transporter family protein [Bacillus timonensis]